LIVNVFNPIPVSHFSQKIRNLLNFRSPEGSNAKSAQDKADRDRAGRRIQTPFVYRLTTASGISGYVRNMGGSEVEIIAEGDENALRSFLEGLRNEKPPLARFDQVSIQELEPVGYKGFRILKSDPDFEERSIASPDFAICSECTAEVLDRNSRFSGYHWNSCAFCDSRFSMLYRLPYDRENTSMVYFPLCGDCAREYADPGSQTKELY
jgi:hydrogenase maturation protein HypF